jgi:uncharacterized protein (TIGR03437 family)
LKKLCSIPSLILFLLAAGGSGALRAQTLIITPNPLNITAQAGLGATAQLTFTSTGAPITFSVTPNPTATWLYTSLGTGQVSTPQTITVTIGPLQASATPYVGYLSVNSNGSIPYYSVPVNVTVSSIGVNPSTLSFQYMAGSANSPPAQSSTLTVPSGITVSLTTSTSSGGNWLLAALIGSPPAAVTAQIGTSVAQALAAGTYTGTITITPTAGASTAPATIQVTLVVSATPQLTVTPSSLSFNYQVNGTNNVMTQPIQLAAGSQDVAFAFTGDSWITTDRLNGTVRAGTSMSVNVTVTPPSSCTPSTSPCSGTLVLNTAGASQNISIRLTVSTAPLLNVSTTPLSFVYQIGTASPAATSVTPGSTGTALQYTVTTTTASGGSWLVVTPTSGTTPTPVSISVDPSKLGPGTYNGTVSLVAPGGLPQSISVTLKVTNDPILVSSPASLWFAYQIGQQLPSTQTIRLTSSNGVPLNYSATTTTSWLLLTGQTSGTTDNSFTVSASPSGLSTNTYTGQIAIAVTNPATGAALAPVNISVTLYVSTNALLLVNPQQPVVLSLQAYSGQSSLLQNYTLTSTSPTDQLALSVGPPHTDSGGQWLGVYGAPVSTAGALGLQATPPVSLAPGTYTGSVTVTATGPAGAVLDSPVTIPVVLQLTSGAISVNSTGLQFSQSVGGSAPPVQTVTVSSNGPVLTFFPAAYDGGLGWLSVSTPTGATTGSFNVSVDGSKLTSGTYQGKVIVLSPFAAGSPAVIPVSFQVTTGTISAPTTTLSFTQVQGGSAPAAQSVTVSGSPGLNFTVATNATWLTATSLTGTVPATLQVGVNAAVASSLSANVYNGTVTITSAGASGSPITIPVTLNVVSPQTFTASPATLSFSYIVGLTVPQAQSFQISSSGGVAPFSVTTPSSASWLQVSPTSGSTPATLTVSVNTQGLTAGNYTAAITINSPYSSSAAAASATVNLTVTQITVRPVAIANAASYAAGVVAPGELIAIFGTSIGPLTAAYGTLNASGTLLNTSAGSSTRVLFDGVPAPVVYASATQTNVVVPYEVAGRPTTSVVVEYQGVQSAPLVYNVQAAVPGIFTQNYSGSGPGAILNQDGITVNGPATPALKGSAVSVYMTGEGQTSPAGVTGAIVPISAPAPWKKPQLTATATVGTFPALVQYYGSAPGDVSGIMQVNVQIPANAPSGTQVPIVITLTDPTTGLSYNSQAQVTVSVL